jgi:hypothetical protein
MPPTPPAATDTKPLSVCRNLLKWVRRPGVTPSTLLPNGMSVSEFAWRHVCAHYVKRPKRRQGHEEEEGEAPGEGASPAADGAVAAAATAAPTSAAATKPAKKAPTKKAAGRKRQKKSSAPVAAAPA